MLGEKAFLKFTPFMIKLNANIHSKWFDSSYVSSLVFPDHMNPSDDAGSVFPDHMNPSDDTGSVLSA